jgi:hypothetical protein
MDIAVWVLTALSFLNTIGLIVVVKILYAILETKVYIERLVNEEKWV